MAEKQKNDLINSINADIPDNNSAAISAADIRNNMVDIVDSVNALVASGDHNTSYPFYASVRASKEDGNGWFIAESGIQFPNSTGETLQYEAYPGPGSINHDQLTNRHASNDAHTQYLSVDGSRVMEGNLPMGAHWINGSGTSDTGLSFDGDQVKVGSDNYFSFSDNSTIHSGRSVAKAWMNFDGSGVGTYGTPIVRASHNIESVEYLDPGKYKITIPSGVLKDENVMAIGHSNSRTTAASQEDFARNTVGITQRTELNGKVSLTFLVLNEAGEYVDAELNDFIVFGYDIGETAPSVTVIPKA